MGKGGRNTSPSGPSGMQTHDLLKSSDLFSKAEVHNDFYNPTRDLQNQMKDRSTIKIQQLFQETKNLNKKLMEVKNYNYNQASSTASKATNVDRPTSRSPPRKTPQPNSFKRAFKDTSSGRKLKSQSPFSETEDSEFSDPRKYRKF